MKPRVLIAGIGNIFMGDDAFGVEVARAAMARQWPEGVRVADFGIRGLDLAFALGESYDAVILVDAAPRGAAPGTLYVIEPEIPAPAAAAESLPDAHAMNPDAVLRLAAAMGVRPGKILLLGCEPSPPSPESDLSEMSSVVKSAVARAVPILSRLVAKVMPAA